MKDCGQPKLILWKQPAQDWAQHVLLQEEKSLLQKAQFTHYRLTGIPPGLCSPLRSPSSSEHRAATTLPALQGCFLGLCHASSGQNGGDSSPLAAGGEGGDGWQQFSSTQKCANGFGKGAQQHSVSKNARKRPSNVL